MDHHGPNGKAAVVNVFERVEWSVCENNEEMVVRLPLFCKAPATLPSEFVLGKFHSSSLFEKFVLCICLCNSNLSALTFLKSRFTHESQSELQVERALDTSVEPVESLPRTPNPEADFRFASSPNAYLLRLCLQFSAFHKPN